MKKYINPLLDSFICLAVMLCTFSCPAQSKSAVIDSVAASIDRYAKSHPSSTLFVHFDKTVYSNFENVWFRAYLLKTTIPLDAIHVLSVFLIRNNDRTIWLENQFVMQNGFSSGNLFLPDSLPPGNFSLVAYTDHVINGSPDDIFIQPITIKTIEADIKLSLSLLNNGKKADDSAEVFLKAYSRDYKALGKTRFKYTLGSTGVVNEASTNPLGEYRLQVPLKKIDPANNILHVELKNGMLFKIANLSLPFPLHPASVKFYPEGGNLVESTPVVVGFEVKNDKGEPLAVNCLLFENKHLLDTITTNADGIGRFTLMAKNGNAYSVRILPDSPGNPDYALPVALPVIPVLTVTNAVAKDTLNVLIKNVSATDLHLYVLLHDDKTLFKAYSINKETPIQYLQIPLIDVPKGVFTITLLDENHRPLAERICFAHVNRQQHITITTDSTVYGTTKRVLLSIALSRNHDNPVDGVFSVACVQTNRIEANKMTDIESYTYLRHQLTNLPKGHQLLSADADNYQRLENALLTRGWRKYTWLDMMHAKNVLQVEEGMNFEGTILKNKRKIKEPMDVGLMSDSSVRIFHTDNDGRFELSPKNLITSEENKLLLFVNTKWQDNFDIEIKNPYNKINRKLSGTLEFENYDLRQRDSSSAVFALNKGEYARVLDAVTVKFTNNLSGFYGHSPYEGKCNDYVCEYGILNCMNHKRSPGNTSPIEGHVYQVLKLSFFEPVIYHGNCAIEKKNNYLLKLDGIYSEKTFYVTDPSASSNAIPEYLSTLYWNPAVHLTGDIPVVISFYTGAITGLYTIIVQGRTDDDVIFGQYFFRVKEKP